MGGLGAGPVGHCPAGAGGLVQVVQPAAWVRSATAPLRLRNEVQLGFKQVKWIKGVENFSQVGGGYGGCNQDHEFSGYRQSI